MKITNIHSIMILDSRGNPTIKAYIELENGIVGAASVPSGASTGIHEACELRDGEKPYNGLGVTKAIHNTNTILNDLLKGKSIEDLKILDVLMLERDGTAQKTTIGANAMLAVSMAAARTLSLYKAEPLWKTLHQSYFSTTQPDYPRLMVNIINGGAHANWNMDFQEYMIISKERLPSKSIQQSSEIFHALKNILKEKKQIISVGDEGGFAPSLENNKEGFSLLNEAIVRAGYSREIIDLGSDMAASEFFKNGEYTMKKENKTFLASELSAYYVDLIESFNILSFEDPFAEDDWNSFASFTKQAGSNHIIVGDDLFVTDLDRIQKGIAENTANAVLIKLNQIGTLFETVQAISATKKAGWKTVISHRSGETEDSFIADLSVACASDFIKTGSMSRSDRLAKYNRLLEIEAREYTK